LSGGNRYKCPSNGRYKKDLVELIKRNEEQSQVEEEAMENIQRRDRKLRAEWKEKK
jgi:chromosome condensin MukBEF ATPase and DNA-binding subunit MukB